MNYLYRKNAQGDITHILDNTGMVVAKYIYDAWGNHAILDGNGDDLTSGVGVLNPFRYRSYYYDEETDLYYLQTRYYDPEVGRFISQDDVSYLAPDSINGLNLYVYCSNNPVMATDPTGTSEWWEFWKWDWAKIGMIALSVLEIAGGIALIVCTTGIGASFGATLIGMGGGSIIDGFINEANGGSFFAGWAGGQIGGFLNIIPVVGAAAGSFVGSILTDIFDGKEIDWVSAGTSAALAFLLGLPSGLFSKIISIANNPIVGIIFGGYMVILNMLNRFIDSYRERGAA